MSQKVTPEQFLARARQLRMNGTTAPGPIRHGMTESLGELSAIAALAYSGDGSDGDLSGFVVRLQELLGETTEVVLGTIALEMERSSRKARE